MRHEIPEEPGRWDSHTSASLCLGGPTEKYGCITSRTNAQEIHEEAGSISHTCELPWPAWGDLMKRLPTKPVWGRIQVDRNLVLCLPQLTVLATIEAGESAGKPHEKSVLF
jgi:hypothetical protein